MKKLTVLMMVLSLGLFSIGCGGGDTTETPSTDAPVADPADPGDTPAPEGDAPAPEGDAPKDDAPKEDAAPKGDDAPKEKTE